MPSSARKSEGPAVLKIGLKIRPTELGLACDRIRDLCEYIQSELRRMALLQERKQEIISDNQVHETDTGSVDVQIAMLTDRINTLSQHLQKNKKDYSSRRGLMKMIGQRKRLLAYLTKQDPERYKALIQKLGIRR